MKNWLTGKKTYIGAGLMAASAIGGYWFGVFDFTTASTILSAATISVGLGHKGDRILEALQAKKQS